MTNALVLTPTHDPCVQLKRLFPMTGLRFDFSKFHCPLRRLSAKFGGGKHSCECNAGRAARELHALGFHEEANALERSFGEAEAKAFGQRLLNLVESLRAAYADVKDKPRGAGQEGKQVKLLGRTVYKRHSTFDEALRVIERLGHWFVGVGRCGSGVRAQL